MNPVHNSQETEFILRRIFEDFPGWVIGFPILFALVVLLLVVLFRQERRGAALVWGLAIVGVFALVYLPLAYLFKPVFSWWVVLVPLLGVALFYVGMMYVKDAQ